MEYNKAVSLLTKSHLAEAKYMLMELSLQVENYTDVYYYGMYLERQKCRCNVIKLPRNKMNKIP